MLLGVDQRGFTQRAEGEIVKLENRGTETEKEIEGKVRHKEKEREERELQHEC